LINRLKIPKNRVLIFILILFAILLIAFIGKFYIPLIWLKSVGYVSVFWKMGEI
jgi:uncharacterized membrane protein (UPF0182 family)